MTRVLAIIVTYNFEPWLKKCLDSILESTHPLDILIIDNKSLDNTVNIIRKDYPQVRLISNAQNLGFGGANNIGLKICINEQYDYAFLINQDAWLNKSCLQELLKVKANNTGIISPMHFDGTEKQLDEGFAVYTKELDFKQEKDYYSLKFVNAAFWLVPANTITKVGLFSPIFYHYGEDVDYANRMKYYNLDFILAPAAIAYHDRQTRKVSKEQYFKSEYVYFLTEYCNINYSFFKALLFSVGAAFKKSALSLIKGNVNDCIQFLKIGIELVTKSLRVHKTRKYNRLTSGLNEFNAV